MPLFKARFLMKICSISYTSMLVKRNYQCDIYLWTWVFVRVCVWETKFSLFWYVRKTQWSTNLYMYMCAYEKRILYGFYLNNNVHRCSGEPHKIWTFCSCACRHGLYFIHGTLREYAGKAPNYVFFYKIYFFVFSPKGFLFLSNI